MGAGGRGEEAWGQDSWVAALRMRSAPPDPGWKPPQASSAANHWASVAAETRWQVGEVPAGASWLSLWDREAIAVRLPWQGQQQ